MLRDENMSSICNVIPIIDYNIIFKFHEESHMMKIVISDRKFKIWFKTIDELDIWRSVSYYYYTCFYFKTIYDMAENNIKEKIDDKIVPVLISEECVSNVNKNVQINRDIKLKNDEHLKGVSESYEKKIEMLQEKFREVIEIKEELTRLCGNESHANKNDEKNKFCREIDGDIKEGSSYNPPEYYQEYFNDVKNSMKRSNDTIKSNKSSPI
jgi:hypothetical protein